MTALLQYMGIDHGGGQVFVSEQLLDCSDVCAPLQQMGGTAKL